jgi:hypothetical protein
MADGTAPQCGRVGSCHILLKALSLIVTGLFYLLETPGQNASRLLGFDGTPAFSCYRPPIASSGH